MADNGGASKTMGDLPGAGLTGTAGRPSRVTDELIERVGMEARSGAFLSTIAEHNDVHAATFHGWMARGRDLDDKVMAIVGDETLTEDEQEDQLYALEQTLSHHQLQCLKLWRTVQKASARAELRLVTGWVEAGKKDWRAAKDFLARRYPDRWAETSRLEHSGPGGGPIVTDDASLRDVALRIAADPQLSRMADDLLAGLAGESPTEGPDVATPGDEESEPPPEP